MCITCYKNKCTILGPLSTKLCFTSLIDSKDYKQGHASFHLLCVVSIAIDVFLDFASKTSKCGSVDSLLGVCLLKQLIILSFWPFFHVFVLSLLTWLTFLTCIDKLDIADVSWWQPSIYLVCYVVSVHIQIEF